MQGANDVEPERSGGRASPTEGKPDHARTDAIAVRPEPIGRVDELAKAQLRTGGSRLNEERPEGPSDAVLLLPCGEIARGAVVLRGVRRLELLRLGDDVRGSAHVSGGATELGCLGDEALGGDGKGRGRRRIRALAQLGRHREWERLRDAVLARTADAEENRAHVRLRRRTVEKCLRRGAEEALAPHRSALIDRVTDSLIEPLREAEPGLAIGQWDELGLDANLPTKCGDRRSSHLTRHCRMQISVHQARAVSPARGAPGIRRIENPDVAV